MGDDKLKLIAAELITQVRNPDLPDAAVRTVLAQAQLPRADWV